MYRFLQTFLYLLLLCPCTFLYGQEAKDTLYFSVMSYNVENLFDCQHDSLKDDHDFLPDAVRHWDFPKYRKKLDQVARVVTAAGEWNLPALVALCEVENDSVMRDLTRRSALREAGYRYVMTHSDDLRGIDVALMYQRGQFRLLSQQSLEVTGKKQDGSPLRPLLHVCGEVLNRDTLDVFAVHFPSRSGGALETEPNRLSAASRLKEAVDSLCNTRQTPRILIMGDFNDYPGNRSIRQILQADAPAAGETPQPNRLYHLLSRKCSEQKSYGSYKYQGEWGLLDHLIVSGNLIDPKASLYTDEQHADVFAPDFLLTEDQKYGGRQPFRTYYGRKYQGGFSDHLPVRATFRLVW